MNPLSAFLEDYLTGHILDEKNFIVPSYRIGHQIGIALARADVPWVNLRFVTLPSLALEFAGADMSTRGLKQISSPASRILINHIFRSLKEDGLLFYYGQLEARSGLIEALARTINDLRLAGVTAETLDPDHFVDRQKGLETQLILERYERELATGKFIDAASLYEAASDIAVKSGSAAGKHYLYLENQVFSKRERIFLDALTANPVCVPQGRVLGLKRPRRFGPPGSGEGRSRTPETDLERTPWLFAPDKAPPPLKDGTLRMFQALGPSNECREVIRRIVRQGLPFDQVEVLHPPGSVYPSLFFGLSEKTGLAFTSSDGLPVQFTIPGKVYTAILDWMENDYPATAFCAALENGWLKTPKAGNDEPLSSLTISRLIKESKIGWGRERYVPRLEALGEEKKRNPDSRGNTERVKAIVSTTRWFREILELFPPWKEDERVEMVDLCAGLSTFMKKFCRIRGERDGEALGSISSRLEESCAFKSLPFTRDEAFEWLRRSARHLRIGASNPLPGRIHLSPYLSGGFSGRPVTFIVGLDQGSVPGARLPDPILLDDEREAVSEDLERTSDRLRENLYSMTALLSSLGGTAVLSFSSYDVIEERLSFPSSFLLQALRLLEGDETLDYSALASYLGSSSGFIPLSSSDLDETDWWLHRVAGDGDFKDILESIKTIFPAISRGDYARRMRSGPDLSSFEGIVSLREGEFDPCRDPELRMSASRFETLADCPYRYFLRYLLDIQPPDEIALDKAQWLDARQRGTLLHDIFCDFMRRLRDRREAVLPEKHKPEIRAVAERFIDRLREENPPPSETVFAREKREILAVLDIFLKAEDKRSLPVDPLLFEVNFGFEGDEGEGIAESVRFELGRGRSFRLNGRIDRVDALGANHFRVIDYKTGSYTPYESVKSFGRGKSLQHALYAEAAEFILKKLGIEPSPRVSLSGYAFPTMKGDGREILIENFDRGRLRELIAELLSFLENGQFPVNPAANCDFCDFGAVCGPDVIDRTKEKKETNAGVFAVFDRLKEFE